MFGPSKNLDKICRCRIQILSSVGTLRHSKIFVNHKRQSRGNKHYSADSGGLHTYVYFSVCIGMDKLSSNWPWRLSWERKLGNRNSCILFANCWFSPVKSKNYSINKVTSKVYDRCVKCRFIELWRRRGTNDTQTWLPSVK